MRRWIAALLCDILIFYMAMLYGSSGMAMAGIAVFIWLFAAFVFLHLAASGISAEVGVPIALAEKNQPVTISMEIKRRNGAKNRTIRKTFAFSEAGMYEVSFERIRIYDMTGLFYVDRKIKNKKTQTIEILPEITETAVRLTEPVRNFFGDAEVYDETRPGHDANEVFQIRSFQEGDKIQSIHWKLSARTGELMVKEYGHPLACPVVLLLDAKERSDAFYTVAASLSFAMMDAGLPHYMAWYSGQYEDIVRFRVDDEESFYEFLASYLAEKDCSSTEPVGKCYEQKYRSELILHKLRLNDTLTLDLDGQTIVQFSEAHVKDQLAGLELVL